MSFSVTPTTPNTSPKEYSQPYKREKHCSTDGRGTAIQVGAVLHTYEKLVWFPLCSGEEEYWSTT